MNEDKNEEKEKLYIKKFEKDRIEFSDGSVITSAKGEFDLDIIKAILEAGE